MKIDLAEAQRLPHKSEARFGAYACLDTTGTLEIYNQLISQLSPDQLRVYRWSMAQLSPSVTMTLRGVLVDSIARSKAQTHCRAELKAAVAEIAAMPIVLERWDGVELETGHCGQGVKLITVKGKCTDGKAHKWPAGWKDNDPATVRCMKCSTPRATADTTVQVRHKWSAAEKEADRKCTVCGTPRTRPKPFEPTSTHQCDHLLYDILKAPPSHDHKTGSRTTNDNALDSIGRKRGKLKPLCDAIVQVRDYQKQLGFLEARLSVTDRFHSSFNVGGAWTGRWSSSKDPFGVGGNLQNITERHRHIFIPDPGKKLGNSDLKTAESLKVAYLSGDESYIEAHKGDVHTYVTRLVWPELPWNGDIAKDKKIASTLLPPWDNVPGHDYRFQSKRIQHGANFGRSAYSIALGAHIPRVAAEAAMAQYFTAFPRIPLWQKWVIARAEAQLPIYNTLRRVVHLMGRPWDGHTHKQGLAFGPQSSIGDVLNLGLWRIWHRHDPDMIELLGQIHDAVLFQFDPAREREVVEAVAECLRVEVLVRDFEGTERLCVVPADIATGWNWGKHNENEKKGALNLRGLQEVTI